MNYTLDCSRKFHGFFPISMMTFLLSLCNVLCVLLSSLFSLLCVVISWIGCFASLWRKSCLYFNCVLKFSFSLYFFSFVYLVFANAVVQFCVNGVFCFRERSGLEIIFTSLGWLFDLLLLFLFFVLTFMCFLEIVGSLGGLGDREENLILVISFDRSCPLSYKTVALPFSS